MYMEEHLFDSEKRVEKETQILDTLLRLITLLPLHHLYRLCDDMCHIGPLRHIPTDSQLTFLLKNLYEDKYHAYLTLDHLEFSWLDGTLAWKIIAENPLLNAYEHNIFGQQEFCLIDAANEWLNSEQRLGMQHKILPYIGIIKDPSRLTIPKNKSTENENIITNFPDRIVKLELEDCNLGIAVSVGSVGAGVPQIIPVIVAGLTEPNIFIEQPELHLHPKIQTELMDFFVSCLNGGSASFLIETHSEYLALRLLRRVRETHANQIKHHDFSITEDKIAFYYFNKINGKTEIKRLRVSVDGEFLDRWPKGFFSERDIELFDEDD